MHDADFLHEHEELDEEARRAIAEFIWNQENIELKTVGIDIGSSTSHLLFAKVALQRQTQGLSSRFVVINREVVWRSPIMLTPFLKDGTIDAHKLEHFIHDAYHDAGFKRSDIDSGAVILTGEAIKRKNARAIDELFADEAGKFVCATAGHKLECTLAAHGSGAVRLSKERDTCVLHIDIGGGTTKLALINKGKLIAVAAFAVGGRLIAQDEGGEWTRVEDSAHAVCRELGIDPSPVVLKDDKVRRRIAKRFAELARDQILFKPLDALGKEFELTEPLPRDLQPTHFTFSGGVSEYIFSHEDKEYGDIAKPLTEELLKFLSAESTVPLVDPGQRIRATVIGASQFTVQVSGKTIYLPDDSILPVHNVPTVHVDMDLSGDIDSAAIAARIKSRFDHLDLDAGSRMAIAFTWQGDPEHARLYAVAKGIVDAIKDKPNRDEFLLVVIDGDVGRTLGRILHKELDIPRKLIALDGVQLNELDFVDVGTLIDPPGVVPVVIKSLLFS
jgi:ethanolamine utilization protein EutA